ncbi:hypothetical protein MFRU_065g00210 [Monilinia fructicola]|uniref:F-box domain-containing protein n=1 Tax=Monilinia fructicola TaxID=38448 RepID=A0A5M9J8G8_MONFR|nr:hypothetical protein EYC84_011136 [Monilinia fructicola]KAG4025148.1 hypothetical protein MFRU_065g00210 [Monilinia fructicola]
MVDSFTGIASLPNELILNSLSLLSTRELLPIASTCHRFHNSIIRIIHHRLLAAASLKDYKLVLECYHPSTKDDTPHLFCDYIGTDGLSDDFVGEGDLYKDVEDTGRLGKMFSLYSHFRPVQPEKVMVWTKSPVGGVEPGLLTKSEEELVSQNLDLESYEYFSQLCTSTRLAKLEQKRGSFQSCGNLGKGVLRVFRGWLSDRAEADEKHIDTPEECENRVLWADAERCVGLRLKVHKREEAPAPLMLGRDEEPTVSYTLQYEELVIRTTQLLLNIEDSLTREVQNSGMTCRTNGVHQTSVLSSKSKAMDTNYSKMWTHGIV